MTKKEIIDGLKFTVEMFLFDPSTGENIPKHLLNEGNRTTVEACEGAIKLLSMDVPDTNVGDMIYRQAAIDIVVFECGRWTGLAKEISKQLKQLSFAQPEPCEKDIIGMIKKYTNCPVGECKKAFDIGIDYLRSKSRVRGSKDTVSRQVEITSFDDGVLPLRRKENR